MAERYIFIVLFQVLAGWESDLPFNLRSFHGVQATTMIPEAQSVVPLSREPIGGPPPGGELSDAELIAQYREHGSRRAFETLIRRHQRAVFGIVMRVVKDADDAADVTQRAFVRVMKALRGFEGRSTFRTWLYRIAINLAKNHLRDEGRRKTVDLDTALPVVSVTAVGPRGIISREEVEKIRAAVDRLPEKQRLTFQLRAYRDLSFKEVAEVMGCRVGTAKVNFHHAVRKLRQELRRDTGDTHG